MRLFLLSALLFIVGLGISVSSVAQDSSLVQWKVSSKKISSSKYELQFTGKIKSGKFLYLFSKDAEGLDSITVNFTDSAIVKDGSLQVKMGSKSFTDPTFENK